MPKGMTPKKRKLKTTVSLARSLKPSGRLNVDDIERAGKKRKEMSLSEIRDAKKLGKMKKMASNIAGTMGVAGSLKSLKSLMDKGPRKMPNPKKEGTRMDKGPRKMESPRGKGTRMDKGPRKMTPLGPVRSLKERSQSKLVSRRRGMGKR